MKLNDFTDSILPKFKRVNPKTNFGILLRTYRDILNSFEVMEWIDRRLIIDKDFKIDIGGTFTSEEKEAFGIAEYKATQMRSMYIHSTIFINTSINELTNRQFNGKSIISYCHTPEPKLKIDYNFILPAYCIVLYRNKLVAHLDIAKSMGESFYRENNDDFRLTYSPESCVMEQCEIDLLNELKGKHDDLIPDQAPYQDLFHLFHNIPFDITNDNRDRKRINQLIEKNGCCSLTRSELLNEIDTFSEEIVGHITMQN